MFKALYIFCLLFFKNKITHWGQQYLFGEHFPHRTHVRIGQQMQTAGWFLARDPPSTNAD
jgi:hypothetical protein